MKNNGIEEQWDIVFGPVANDQTMQTLILYLDGFLTKQETIERLLPQKLTDQVTFKTEKALTCLKCKEIMNKMVYFVLDYYDRKVIERMIEKYAMNPMDAVRNFLKSETHALLEDADNDMWESEKITGDPRNSIYLRGE